jgi:outer membrane biosynthesis protein TonB
MGIYKMGLANVTKGDAVVLLGFTGIRLADVKIKAATKTELTVEKADGTLMIFDRKTGVQKNVVEGKEKYANKIVHPDDAPAPKEKKAKAPAAKKAVKKAPEPVEEEDEDEDEEEDEEEEVVVAPKKKTKPAAPAKKKKAVVEEDDDYEEM